MKEKHISSFSALLKWTRRYWFLIVLLLFFGLPIIVFVAIGVPPAEAVYSVSMLLHGINGRGFDLSPDYHPVEAIAILAVIVAILVFIVFSIVRYFYKSRK